MVPPDPRFSEAGMGSCLPHLPPFRRRPPLLYHYAVLLGGWAHGSTWRREGRGGRRRLPIYLRVSTISHGIRRGQQRRRRLRGRKVRRFARIPPVSCRLSGMHFGFLGLGYRPLRPLRALRAVGVRRILPRPVSAIRRGAHWVVVVAAAAAVVGLQRRQRRRNLQQLRLGHDWWASHPNLQRNVALLMTMIMMMARTTKRG